MRRIDVYQGDSREVLRVLDDASIDAVVTDPPYALVSIVKRFGAEGAAACEGAGPYSRASAGFMGQQWDTGETAFAVEFWREVYRVMKPGAHLVAFGGTRTYHRLACAIEDAGFEIRDMKAWLYGSGFPKSHNVAKGIDNFLGQADSPEGAPYRDHGTALKPALEPICLARKPMIGSVARNVLAHGTGALNIGACRIETDEDRRRSSAGGDNGLLGSATFKIRARAVDDAPVTSGRWPANVLHDGSDEVVAAFPNVAGGGGVSNRAAPKFGGVYGDFGGEQERFAGYDDQGSAARFFYSAKADSEDRLGSEHPTVKPVDLMQWLVRLICPPRGVVLDPFGGSGTTGLAAMNEGRDAILIEREASHADDIRRRIAWARGEGAITRQEILRHDLAKNPETARGMDTPLFGGLT